ncbi:MAG: magnesium transporter, partial [Clostridiales bacterium]|nr:magnesium transporter [Clostridiales bacterium]
MSELFTFITDPSTTNRQIHERLSASVPADVADILDDLDRRNIVRVFRLLSKTMAADVFSYLSQELQEYLLEVLTDKEIAGVVNEMFFDDAVDMVEELPANLVSRMLKNASDATRAAINALLQYPDGSAGSIMTTEYISLAEGLSVAQAFERIRRTGTDTETIYTCYV